MASGTGSQMVASRRLALVLPYNTNVWCWLLLVASRCYIAWKDIFKGTYWCNFSVFLKDSARTQSQALPGMVWSSIWLLLPAWCRASFGPCLRTGVTGGVFLMKMVAQWPRLWARMLAVERNLGGINTSWGNLLSLAAAFGQTGHVLIIPRADTSLTERGKIKGAGKIPSSSLWLRWDPISAFSPVCLGHLFSPPLKRADAAEPRNPQADVHSSGEKKRQGMILHFIPSLPCLANLGCRGLRNHRQSRSGTGGTELQSRAVLLGSDEVKLILGLSDRLDLVIKSLQYITEVKGHFGRDQQQFQR